MRKSSMMLKMKNNMTNANNVEAAQKLVGKLSGQNVKFIRKDSSLIERKNLEDDKVILAEDNRQLLLG